MNIRYILHEAAAFWFGRRLESRRAGVALIVALSLPALVGFTSFEVDASMWSAQHITLQTATDLAAMKAASDLATTPSISNATLIADAVAAASQAQPGQFNLTTANLTVTQLTDQRQVKVSATILGSQFFSHSLYPFPVNISASSTAGIGYSLVSNQATCYSVDSYTYLYSTGFGTIDTAHSSGIDPYQCTQPPATPSAYDAYCGGGVLGCSLDFLNAGSLLLPFAIQLGQPGANGGLNVVLAPVVNTLNALLVASTPIGSGAMTIIGPGSPQCTGSSASGYYCTVAAGIYNGGLTIEPNVTVSFVPTGNSDYFVIENGDFVMSNQSTLGDATNAVFYFGGSNPGGFVQATQVQINTAPLNAGAVLLSSSSTFQANSIIGTQTSAPLSAMPFAQQQAETRGLLSMAGLPAQNLVGTNFESVVAVCQKASSTCPAADGASAIFQSTTLPSVSILTSLLPGITPIDLLANEGETSTTTISSGITFANGVPTDWQQQETANSTLTNVLQTVPSLLKYLGVSAALAPVVKPLATPLFNAIAPNETNSQTEADSGIFPGQSSNGVPSCTAQQTLYSKTITPNFSPGFSDILDTAGENGANGALTTSDTITVCGQSPIGSINVIGAGTTMVNSTAAGASAVLLLQ